MKIKIYTAAIVVDDFSGKTSISDGMYCKSFATRGDMEKWVDEINCEIAREYGADGEGHNWCSHENYDESEIDVPVSNAA